MQDGAVAERVDEAWQAAGLAVDVGLGIIGEDRGGMTAAAGVVVDVIDGGSDMRCKANFDERAFRIRGAAASRTRAETISLAGSGGG